MKKILLSALAVFAFGVANAQEITSSKGENYLPKQGDWSIGFNANSALEFVGNAFNGSTGNKVALGAQYSYGVFFKYKSVNDASTINFNIGTPDSGFGTASVLLNLYF